MSDVADLANALHGHLAACQLGSDAAAGIAGTNKRAAGGKKRRKGKKQEEAEALEEEEEGEQVGQ